MVQDGNRATSLVVVWGYHPYQQKSESGFKKKIIVKLVIRTCRDLAVGVGRRSVGQRRARGPPSAPCPAVSRYVCAPRPSRTARPQTPAHKVRTTDIF